MTHSAPQADCTPDVEQRLELLLAQLPLAPLKVLAPFVVGSDSTLHRHLNDLVDVGLVDSLPNQLQAEGRPGRLFYLASLGLTAARSDGVEPSALAQKLGLGGTHAAAAWLSKRLPGLLTAYELLALLAARGPGHAWLDGNRSGDVSRRRAPVPDVVRVLRDCQPVPAFVWTTPDGFLAREYVLVPDTGGLALPALRAALGHLAVYQAATQAQSTLAIATTTPRRAAGWTSLVETVCHAHGLPALDSEVTTWADLRREAARAAAALPIAFRKPPPRPVPRSAAQVDTPVSPRTTLPKSVCRVTALIWTRLGHLDRAVLDLVARHPFLPTALVGDVLGNRGIEWARARRVTLVTHDLVWVLPAQEVEPHALGRLRLLEATRVGVEVTASQLGLPLMAAVHHHGLTGGGPETPVGPHAALLTHLPHTLGAEMVFAAVARAARAHRSGGALLEWRGPPACTHGRLRPDGYGLLRLGSCHYGFFLEFDRGSMHAGRLRAKFIAYHRFAASTFARRSYVGLPTILVVTTSPGAERRIAGAVAAADIGQVRRLSALLTTTGWLEMTAAGPLGPVWRTALDSSRRAWPGGSDR